MDFGPILVSISDYLNTSGVTMASVTGFNSDGAPTWGAAAAIRCRYEAKRKLLRLPNGDTVVSAGRLFVEPTLTVAIGNKIIYGSTTYQVLEIDEQMGFNSLSHRVLTLGG